MKPSRMRPLLGITTSIIFLNGCGLESGSLETLRQTASTSLQMTQSSRSSSLEGTGVQAVFQPLYPSRDDPFSYPGEGTTEDSSGPMVATNAAQVDLVGFANVGHPRVFLKIGEATKSLQVGDSVQGVEVLDIDPPTVRLRMGNLVWHASMFDPASRAPQP